ncbi:helix-turn-helix domain-containing protein [Candidatus Saccharimonas aalborgensis]|uniref:helix-turn-helix domain-containing protein n=1 Tax=Candidatus Saccharimonas aalborgensis TaxID=1332188 RepID=UPI00059BF5AE
MLSSNLATLLKLNSKQPAGREARKGLDMGSATEQPNHPALYTVEEAAEYLRVSRWMIYKLMRHNELRTLTIASRRLIAYEDLTDFIKQSKRKQYEQTTSG